jgi:hypothetical protein
MGIMAAEGLADGTPAPLWHVNTETTYQEAAPSSSLRSDG